MRHRQDCVASPANRYTDMLQRSLGFALCVALCSIVRADHGIDRKALNVRYSQVAAALKNRDMPALLKMATPDVVFVDPTDHKYTGAKAGDQFGALLSMFKSVDSVDMKVGKVDFIADEARATTQSRVRGTLVGRRAHRLTLTLSSQEIWVRRGKRWMLKELTTKNVKPVIDGKG